MSEGQQNIPTSLSEEKLAIQNYDYKRAEEIYLARLASEQKDFDDDTNNILDTVDQAKISNSNRCIEEMEQATRDLEDDRDVLTTSLATELEKLAERQRRELEALKQSWRNDRDKAVNQARERAQNMLASSQELAAIHCYEPANELLAEGQALLAELTQSKEVFDLDNQYRRLVDATLSRHRSDLETLRYQYSLDALLLDKRCEGDCVVSRMKCEVANSNIGPSLSKSAASPKKGASLNVVKLTSPRSAATPKKASPESTRVSSYLDSDLPSSPPRSPNRMGNREPVPILE